MEMIGLHTQHAKTRCSFQGHNGWVAGFWRAMFVAIASGLCLLSIGCAPTAQEEMHILTWREYDGWENRDKVIYVLDGIEVGKGDVGWENVLKRLRQLKSGETVFIYPYYLPATGSIVSPDGKVTFVDEPNGPPRHLPFHGEGKELHKLVESHELIIIYSPTEPGAKASGRQAIKFRLLGPNAQPDAEAFIGERPPADEDGK